MPAFLARDIGAYDLSFHKMNNRNATNEKSDSFMKAKVFTERKTPKLPFCVLFSSKLNNLVTKTFQLRVCLKKGLNNRRNRKK